MNRFNSISVSFEDLIKHQQERVDYLKRTKDANKAMGKSAFYIDHNLECAERILSLLKKHKKDPQGDLFREFQNTRR
jgi:hypothetical protein